ncbi:winged helix-turn-helix transcriptional regulator [Asticcacaulis benevestitus]|nr:helix-turn-helix domain-containing protein [Asticcacaulis benevestitus]
MNITMQPNEGLAITESDSVHEHAHCRAMGYILDRIADKWTIMAVGALSHGPMRFNEIMRKIGGVSHRMLTLTLRSLEREGLVTRTAFATIPPKVVYDLTDRGRSLLDPLTALSDWAHENRAAMEVDRARYDREQGTPSK